MNIPSPSDRRSPSSGTPNSGSPWWIAGLLGAVLFASCTVRSVQSGPPLDLRARWALLPVLNHSDTPQAGENAAAILETLLRSRGVVHLAEVPVDEQDDALPELSERRRLDNAMTWARKKKFRYGVTGSVEEWRYRGLDGQPAAGLTVRVIDLSSGDVVFSASGARSGWGRDTISGVAQQLLADLTRPLRLTP